jgi:hopanoid biosynthesis associated RND transporter like protein HpnN
VTEIEQRLGRALARGVGAVSERPLAVIAAVAAVTVAAGLFAFFRLGVISDTDELFDASLPFRVLRKQVEEALPLRSDTLLVVVDAPTDVVAADAARELAARAALETDLVASAFAPGAGPFFERNGFLYLDTTELETLADRVAAAQPFLAKISQDPSLRGVLGQLERGIDRVDLAQGGGPEPGAILASIAQAVRDAEGLDPHPHAFGDLLLGGAANSAGTRRYVIVKPVIDYGEFAAGKATLSRLRELFGELRFAERGIVARITGDLALKAEEFSSVQGQAATAGVVSFLLVSGILVVAVGSARLIIPVIATLLAGLVWTAGFAALAIGHLNLISVAFAVLFIGLAVDFGLHFVMRYEEVRRGGASHRLALEETARGVGGSLVLCAVTTAIGFYAFLPTGYLGVAELGLIAGTGMGFSLLLSLTLTPALLSFGDAERVPRAPSSLDLGLPRWPLRHAGAVLGVALVLGVGGAILARDLHFDANPLNVRDPRVASVQTFNELIDGGDLNPWSIDVLADDLDHADALAAELGALESVDAARTLTSYVPGDQAEKLAVIEDMALFLEVPTETLATATATENAAALASFRASLAGLAERSDPPLRDQAGNLGAQLDTFSSRFERDEAAAEALHVVLVEALVDRVARLEVGLSAERFGIGELPEALRGRLLAEDGRALIEVSPREGLGDDAALDRFVGEVRSVTERATGTSVYMFESARAIVAALQQALATALVLVAIVLLALWRSGRDTLLVLAPLVLAGILTSAVCVLAGLSINFADVIVVPLLLGVGVDSGIHLVHRHRDGEGDTAALAGTSTPRAILWSALTTMASFGSLAFASHLGMASLGQLLTLGVALMLACNLIVLPALLVRFDRQSAGR